MITGGRAGALLLLASGLACPPRPGGPAPPVEVLAGAALGSTYSVKLLGPLEPAQREAASRAVARELERVDALMSNWREDSELSRFNRHRSASPFPVAPELLDVFRIAEGVSRSSGGAFDVSVGPLVDAWGFGPSGPADALPDPAKIAEVRAHVGWEKIEIDAEAGTLRKRDPRLECDLSAIAVGYAVDRIWEVLGALGHRAFLVDVGGEIRTRGRRPDGSAWRVAIERPDLDLPAAQVVVALEGAALATSGDYRNYYERGGLRFSHLIDPRSGAPVRHALASVSVVHATAAQADAWATALAVLGTGAGFSVAEREGLAAYFITRREAGGFQSRMTAAWRREVHGADP